MAALVDIRPAERRPAILAFSALFGITAGHTLLETARDALFLARLPASQLPWVYLGIAGAGLLISRLTRKSSNRAQSKYAVSIALATSAGITLAFWAGS